MFRSCIPSLFASVCLACAVGCAPGEDGGGGSDDEGGFCAESAEVVICEGKTNCAFDPADIDCLVACTNLQTICAQPCDAEPGCTDFDINNCQTGCNFAKDQACPNVTFGCEAENDTCDGHRSCVDKLK